MDPGQVLVFGGDAGRDAWSESYGLGDRRALAKGVSHGQSFSPTQNPWFWSELSGSRLHRILFQLRLNFTLLEIMVSGISSETAFGNFNITSSGSLKFVQKWKFHFLTEGGTAWSASEKGAFGDTFHTFRDLFSKS